MQDRTDALQTSNRVLWMVIFLAGFLFFGYLQWRAAESSAMGWFLMTSLWSAVCAFGFTAGNWWVLRSAEKHGVDPRND